MTCIWEEQEQGRWMGVATPRGVAYAEGDEAKLAAVGFASFLQSRGIVNAWTLDEPLIITARSDRIGVSIDTGDDPATFTVADSGEPWTLAVRILQGRPPVLLLVGLSSVLHQQIDHFGPALPQQAFLRVSDWLTQFNVPEFPDRKEVAA